MKIGFGQKDITPRGGMISLIGQFESRYSDVINDPLYASVMIIQSDDKRAVFITADNLVPYSFAVKAICEELKKLIPDITEDELILSTTHIHTGPGYPPPWDTSVSIPDGALSLEECAEQELAGIIAAVKEASENMHEARIELSYSYIQTGVCRLVGYADGHSEMYGDPHADGFKGILGRDGGPSQIIYVSDTETGELTGIIAAVPCPAQCDETANYITADYWGVVRSCLAGKYGENVKLLPLCRAAGDLSPHHIVDLVPGKECFGGREEALIMGRRVAKAIIDSRSDVIFRFEGDVPFEIKAREIRLPTWEVSEEKYAWASDYLSDGSHFDADGNALNTIEFLFAKSYKYYYELPEHFVTSKLYAVSVGRIMFITFPFELFTEYADRVRMGIKGYNVIDVQLSYENLGYLAVNSGSSTYSTSVFNCPCPPDDGPLLVRESVELLKSLRKVSGR